MSTTPGSPGTEDDTHPGTTGTTAVPRTTAPGLLRRPTTLIAALAVLAVLAPVGWLAARPAPDAGVPLAEALAPSTAVVVEDLTPEPDDGPAAPSAPDADAAAPSPFGEVGVRDASLDALDVPVDPAPTRLQVAGLGIDAAVDAVGVEDDGSMVIPAEIARVGWYRFGPAVGAEQGNAVLAGHVDAEGEGPGALFDLRGVAIGTEVTVTDEDGGDHVFEVVSRETLSKEALPVDEIFARDGTHRLVIITCGGPFLPELSSYRDNVVVTAVPVSSA